jgi:hypothetical protein
MLTTHIHLVPKLMMRGGIYPLPHTSVWRGAYLRTKDNFKLTCRCCDAEVDTSVSVQHTVSIFRAEGGSMLLRNAGIYLRVHTASQPRRTTWPPLQQREPQILPLFLLLQVKIFYLALYSQTSPTLTHFMVQESSFLYPLKPSGNYMCHLL